MALLLDDRAAARTLLRRGGSRDALRALSSALAAKDGGLSAHSRQVLRYASELAAAVAPRLLRSASARWGFVLHDVGKIAIPDAILRKPAALDVRERRAMERHPLVGEQLLAHVPAIEQEGLNVVRSHHERWDGGGYPDGLRGLDIPVEARLFAVADALDAMTSERPYRAAREWTSAAAEIVRQAGRQFDPAVVKAFEEREARLRALYLELRRSERGRGAGGPW